ncbi:hypothetical protein GCM10009841_00770 [Microlunatus panaciterrae]
MITGDRLGQQHPPKQKPLRVPLGLLWAPWDSNPQPAETSLGSTDQNNLPSQSQLVRLLIMADCREIGPHLSPDTSRGQEPAAAR